MSSDYSSKQDDLHVEHLLDQEKNVKATIVEDQLVPALREEPLLGPVPDIRPEIDGAPDVSALAHWMDDLSEYGDDHLGETKPSTLLDQITTHELDETAEVMRAHLKDDVEADDEQQGMVPDFHADTKLEGAAIAVPPASPFEDFFIPATPSLDPLGYNGGDGGGGGGTGAGGWPPTEGGGLADEGDGDEGEGEGEGEGKPDPEAKQDKGKIGKLVDRVLRRDTAQQKPQPKVEPPKPADKPKKPDGA